MFNNYNGSYQRSYTYRKIKTDFKREQYLYADVDKKILSNFIKICVSNCNLNIEKVVI